MRVRLFLRGFLVVIIGRRLLVSLIAACVFGVRCECHLFLRSILVVIACQPLRIIGGRIFGVRRECHRLQILLVVIGGSRLCRLL